MTFHPLTYDRDLRRYSRFLTGKTDLDLLQSTYLKAYRYKDNFDGKNLKAWLFTIMKNLYLNEVKRKNLFFDEPYMEPVTEEAVYDMIHLNHVNEAIDSLVIDQKNAIKLMVYGYKYEEMAQIFDVPISTLKTRIWAGRQKLKNLNI
jgi:RNA polymerase sigma factor (sigma-70 family)